MGRLRTNTAVALLLAAVYWAWAVRDDRLQAGAPADLPSFDPQTPLTDKERDRRVAAVRPGLSPDQVRRLIGAPRHTARQVLYHRYLEQWVYDDDGTFSLRLEFDCPRGQEPHLLSVQPPGADGP